MGYELHITRAEKWWDNEGREITWEEWLSLVAEDPELTLDPANEDDFALWGGPGQPAEGWFEWHGGNIETKHPDRRMIEKMIRIAARLGARVQGDEGEYYDLPPDR